MLHLTSLWLTSLYAQAPVYMAVLLPLNHALYSFQLRIDLQPSAEKLPSA